jgi:hypothetical protein
MDSNIKLENCKGHCSGHGRAKDFGRHPKKGYQSFQLSCKASCVQRTGRQMQEEKQTA